MIQRFTLLGGFTDPAGAFVRYADHLTALAAKDADIEMLRAMYSRAEQEAAGLRAALELAMSWINNWQPAFIDDEEWPTDAHKIRAALEAK